MKMSGALCKFLGLFGTVLNIWGYMLCLFVLTGLYICSIVLYCSLWLPRKQFLVSADWVFLHLGYG